jgi:hypothetical protein
MPVLLLEIEVTRNVNCVATHPSSITVGARIRIVVSIRGVWKKVRECCTAPSFTNFCRHIVFSTCDPPDKANLD